MILVREPKVDYRPETPYMGIRVQVPMRGMSAVTDRLLKELSAWLKQHGGVPVGPPFRRFHVIDMAGEMDVEVGIPVDKTLLCDGRVSAGVLPAGHYANLVFIGHGLSGNKALIEWAKAHGYTWDRWDDPKGDGFRSRYEAHLTDPITQPLKTKWEVEVAIKVLENPPQ